MQKQKNLKKAYVGLSFSFNLLGLLNAHKKVLYNKNDMLVEQNSTTDCYWVILSGVVRSFVFSSDGEEITTGFYKKDAIALDFPSFFLKKKSVENLVCVSEVKAYKISKSTFFEYFEKNKDLQDWGRNWMVNFLISRQDYFLNNYTKDAKQKYLNLINTNPEVLKYVPLKAIASYLGVTDSTLSRIRKDIH